ncbi:protein deglycase HchA [Shimia sp. R9_2]|uniref:glyoxalase III HchA n=1 Tax=Shimia sp. R9_2 TaxID=2821112 RepID=UPI001ADB6BF1|nr:glyoxalase III HchA [Shimia sp. R9_2]MBO9399154.1 protein deglycase HchA [Shimia sp. R9_2]
MSFLKKLLKTAPTPTSDGAYEPSPLSLKLATSPKTDFDGGTYASPYQGSDKRVLVVCTEERNMKMANGKKFSTGNHPVELGLPMLHLLSAGFEVDIVTPTGAPAVVEDWAMPREDATVMKLYQDYADALQNPGSLADFVATSLTDTSPYVAVFMPGGHGAMLGLPESDDLGKLLRWAHNQDLFTLAICHGPAALLAAGNEADFIYKGYKIAAFPDAVDKQTPMIGYLPGHMPWKFGERLASLGVEIVNKKADAACHIDRKLITGASPKAANNFGRLAAETLLSANR